MPKNNFLLFSIIWFLLTVYGLFFHIPNESELAPFPHFDKIAHFGLFFGQFWLLCKLYLKEGQKPPFKLFFVLAVVWAVLSEVIQGTLTTTRTADVFDSIADVAGASLALWVAYYLWQLRKKLMENPHSISKEKDI